VGCSPSRATFAPSAMSAGARLARLVRLDYGALAAATGGTDMTRIFCNVCLRGGNSADCNPGQGGQVLGSASNKRGRGSSSRRDHHGNS
jgi:hypothetical protein